MKVAENKKTYTLILQYLCMTDNEVIEEAKKHSLALPQRRSSLLRQLLECLQPHGQENKARNASEDGTTASNNNDNNNNNSNHNTNNNNSNISNDDNNYSNNNNQKNKKPERVQWMWQDNGGMLLLQPRWRSLLFCICTGVWQVYPPGVSRILEFEYQKWQSAGSSPTSECITGVDAERYVDICRMLQHRYAVCSHTLCSLFLSCALSLPSLFPLCSLSLSLSLSCFEHLCCTSQI